jgi:hypothetical protein
MLKRLTIEQMQEIATSRGGKCLSDTYIDAHTKLIWKCSKEHIWLSRATDIFNNGYWCPHCARKNKHTILDLKLTANNKGGDCLSTIYTNTHAKYRWICELGHLWNASASTVINRTWCPYCSGNKK